MRCVSLLVLSACAAATPPVQAPSVDYTPIPTEAPPPHGTLYATCMTEGTVSAAYTDDSSLLVFTCTGKPAEAFFNGLAAWSAREQTEFFANDRTYRATTKVAVNLFGVDHCSVGKAADDPVCVITLNAGRFLRELPSPAAP
jgi:hypothetical protein